VLLIVDLVLVALIALAMSLAVWRGRARAKRSVLRAPVSGSADLIPGRAPLPTHRRPRPQVVVDPAVARATWSASSDRGEIAPPVPEPTSRPAVVVAPRGSSWVVRREGASRVSSVHTTREAAEARARKTARRERVVLEVRDEHASVLDRTDFSAAGRAKVSADGATAPRS
jgi:hypothetical protein